jgi:hypothetical protein
MSENKKDKQSNLIFIFIILIFFAFILDKSNLNIVMLIEKLVKKNQFTITVCLPNNCTTYNNIDKKTLYIKNNNVYVFNIKKNGMVVTYEAPISCSIIKSTKNIIKK